MMQTIVKLILGIGLVSSLKQTKDVVSTRLSRQVRTDDIITMHCPFRVAKVNKEEIQVGLKTLGY